ncbi:hypothetical protein [Streptomyces cacaoi]|nr:hypothetical protein [Streptomyces cacaoi]
MATIEESGTITRKTAGAGASRAAMRSALVAQAITSPVPRRRPT